MGASVADIPPQGAGIAELPAIKRESEHLVTGVGPHLVKKALPGCARQKLKKVKAKESEAKTGGIQQPGHASTPRQGTTLTKTPKRPRSEECTLTKIVGPPKRPKDTTGPGNFKEALTNTIIAIFIETYPEDKLTERDQNNILGELGKALHGTPAGELPHLKS
jgi:hypothetical protein